jgi:hypothetical protein
MQNKRRRHSIFARTESEQMSRSSVVSSPLDNGRDPLLQEQPLHNTCATCAAQLLVVGARSKAKADHGDHSAGVKTDL